MNITASRFKVIVSCEVFNILSERILPPGQGEVAQSVVLLKLAAHWPTRPDSTGWSWSYWVVNVSVLSFKPIKEKQTELFDVIFPRQ